MKKTIFLSIFASFLLANNYAVENSDLTINSKKVATIVIGSEFKIIKKGDKTSKISLQGYRPKGSKIIYDTLGVLSTSIILDNNKSVKVLGTKLDEYENEWEIVSLEAFIDNSKITNNDVISVGKELFEERCGVCHALHSYDEFSKNVWPSTIKSMQDNSGLDENEYYQVVKYLQRVAPSDDE